MADKPSDFPDYATDTNYTSGPHNGTPTKVALQTVDVEQGNIAGIPPDARKFNSWQGNVGEWVRWLEEQWPAADGDDGDVLTTDGTGGHTWETPIYMPDPAGADDGDVLTANSGAAEWAAPAGDEFPKRFLTTSFTEVVDPDPGGPVYHNGLAATWDLPALMDLPDDCIVPCRVQWTAVATEEPEFHAATFTYAVARYAGGVLQSVSWTNDADTIEQFHAPASDQANNWHQVMIKASAFADTGVITSEFVGIVGDNDNSPPLTARAILIVEDVLDLT